MTYLALTLGLFAPSIESLAALKLPKGSKVVLEKPFGESLESAQALNRLLHESFPECDVFRLDPLLGKQTVQNILGLRSANRIFEPVWNTHHIERSRSSGTKRSRRPDGTLGASSGGKGFLPTCRRRAFEQSAIRKPSLR